MRTQTNMVHFFWGGGGVKSASYVKLVKTQSGERGDERMQDKAFCL
jgi:hypothetical protein